MTVYVLIYDVDHGSREDCNIFYSPIEVFATAVARQERINLLTKTNSDIGWREEDLELQTTGDFEIPEHYLPYDDEDEDEDDDSSDDDADEDNDEFAEGSEALTLLEELAEEVAPEPVNNGIDFSDDFMNLSLDDFLSAIENTVVLEEKRKAESVVVEPELNPEDCYYTAFSIDNPWDGSEDVTLVAVIPKNKFDGVKNPTLVEIPYGMVPVVMTEAHTGAYFFRGEPKEAKEIMNRYGFEENSDFHMFCKELE